jgi:sulfur relay (sulfurtransferase) complex TusBCD TusD component (DsrE family)
LIGYLLQNSPQDRNGFEVFFEACLAGLKDDPEAWVFLRGDGIYQGINSQRLDEPGFNVPVAGGWNALLARGVRVYVNRRCSQLRGFHKEHYFLPEAEFATLEKLGRLCLLSRRVVVI